MGSVRTRQFTVAGCYEHSYELSVYIKSQEFLYRLSRYYLLKKEFALWSE
jgi:hypothetical protein